MAGHNNDQRPDVWRMWGRRERKWPWEAVLSTNSDAIIAADKEGIIRF